jgi:hypothetical protein
VRPPAPVAGAHCYPADRRMKLEMTRRQQLTLKIVLVLVVAVCLALTGVMVAAWPATGAPGPVVTPITYGAPGPNGGPR